VNHRVKFCPASVKFVGQAVPYDFLIVFTNKYFIISDAVNQRVHEIKKSEDATAKLEPKAQNVETF
jgi:hypothetical protein